MIYVNLVYMLCHILGIFLTILIKICNIAVVYCNAALLWFDMYKKAENMEEDGVKQQTA